jgi:hypothetical protein
MHDKYYDDVYIISTDILSFVDLLFIMCGVVERHCFGHYWEGGYKRI